MSDSVGGAGSANGAGGTNGASSVGGTDSPSAKGDTVDGAMSDVSNAEVAKAAESVTGSVDSFENAGICVGTESECKKAADEKAKKEAEAMTDEQAIQSLDGAFLHDPTSLTPSQVKGLEALSRQENLTERTRGKIRDFLQDHYNNTDRLGFYGQLGRPDAPHF